MKIIGLTGPIASGKDEVAKILRRRGAFVIDADKVAHTLYAPRSAVWHKLVEAFGSKILNRGGKINRRKLGEMVFVDPRKLKKLNGIVHPHLRDAIIQIVESRKSTVENRKMIIINAAVLKEIGLLEAVNEVWLVIAGREIRLKRLIKSGISRQDALRRVNAQMSKKEYLKFANVVVENNSTREALKHKIPA